jgi:hypothetical protein
MTYLDYRREMMAEMISRKEKFQEASACLRALLPEIRQLYADSDYNITLRVDRVDEEDGVVVLGGSKSYGMSVSPFILREPELSWMEEAFKSRLPWVTRVVDHVVDRLEKNCAELGVEMNSRAITGEPRRSAP